MITFFYVSLLYLCVGVYEISSFPWPSFFTSGKWNPDEKNRTLPELLLYEDEYIMVKAFERLGLIDVLKQEGITVFGPTNEAFRKMPRVYKSFMYRNKTFYEQVLKYHVINETVYSTDLADNTSFESVGGQPIRINTYRDGKITTVSGSPIVKADLNATNGVLHKIGRVMIPPVGDIVDTLKLVKYFSILVNAIESVNLTSDITGNGTFTLFAPVDKAFRRIMPLPKNKTLLTELLQYHLVPEVYYSAGFTNGQKIATENGKNVTVSIKGRRWHRREEETYINDARIIFPDITCTNGVIHVIDKVLMPPEESVPSFTVIDSSLRFTSLLQIFGL